MIVTTYESGIPIEAIVNTIDSTIKDIKSKSEDKHKTIIKSKTSWKSQTVDKVKFC